MMPGTERVPPMIGSASSQDILIAHYVPGTHLGTSHVLSAFLTTLGWLCYYLHLTVEESEATRSFKKKPSGALAGVAQWTEHWPVNQGVANSIPNQDTCLGCGPGLQWGACKRQLH